MSITQLSYVEYEGDPRMWCLEPLDFGPLNLVVGRNATGKSRLSNVITGLMSILSGKKPGALSSGTYDAHFRLKEIEFRYQLAFNKNIVTHESLSVNGENRMSRAEDGVGKIFYEKENRFLDFSVDPTAIAINARRDKLQHPYIFELSEWAEASATYRFGTDFGKETLLAMVGDASAGGAEDKFSKTDDPNDPISTYTRGFKRFGADFDQAILEDMRSLGYEIDEVAAENIDPSIARATNGVPLITMVVVEKGISTRIPQIYLSQGMFRVLALVIKLNWAVFNRQQGLIIIDDLGEGLDYERSCAAVKLTLGKAKSGGFQVIATTNDRFVMNSVPLDNWIVLHRRGSTVRGYTARNSREKFDNFKYTGLSNFDFFASGAFEENDE